jgi:hypothetical protein
MPVTQYIVHKDYYYYISIWNTCIVFHHFLCVFCCQFLFSVLGALNFVTLILRRVSDSSLKKLVSQYSVMLGFISGLILNTNYWVCKVVNWELGSNVATGGRIFCSMVIYDEGNRIWQNLAVCFLHFFTLRRFEELTAQSVWPKHQFK